MTHGEASEACFLLGCIPITNPSIFLLAQQTICLFPFILLSLKISYGKSLTFANSEEYNSLSLLITLPLPSPLPHPPQLPPMHNFLSCALQNSSKYVIFPLSIISQLSLIRIERNVYSYRILNWFLWQKYHKTMVGGQKKSRKRNKRGPWGLKKNYYTIHRG